MKDERIWELLVESMEEFGPDWEQVERKGNELIDEIFLPLIKWGERIDEENRAANADPKSEPDPELPTPSPVTEEDKD